MVVDYAGVTDDILMQAFCLFGGFECVVSPMLVESERSKLLELSCTLREVYRPVSLLLGCLIVRDGA